MLTIIGLILILACQTQTAFVEYQCVKITESFEDLINGTWILQLDFEPFSCPEGVKMDPNTTLTGVKSRQMDKLVYNEKSTHIDKRYFKVGTELLIITNHVVKRLSPVAIGLWAGLGFGSFTAFLSGILFHVNKPEDYPKPVYVRPREDPNANYFEQLRLLEIKDAEYKLKSALKKAQSMDPTQTAPAKKTGKQGEWCTAVVAKSVSLSNNNAPSTSAAARPGPSGTGPTPPPTPSWTKETPAPRVGTERPNKRKNNQPFIRDPKVLRISDRPAPIAVQASVSADGEIEVFDVSDGSDSDVVIVETRGETFINNMPGSSLSVHSRVCEDIHPTGVAELDHFRETQVALVTVRDSSSSSSSSNTVEISSDEQTPGNRELLPGVQPFYEVINNAPAIRTHGDPSFVRDALDETPRLGRQAWMDIGWGTPSRRVTNTCNMDSFLSHVTYTNNVDPSYFNQVLRLVSSEVEDAIRRILRITQIQGLSQRQMDDKIHMTWVQATRERYPIAELSTDGESHINVIGSEFNSITTPMVNSSQIFISHVCACPDEEPLLHQIRSRVLAGRSSWTATTIRWFTNSEIQDQNSRTGTTMEAVRCDACTENYRAVRGYVLESTWFHSFELDERQDQTTFDLDSYPRSLEFEELVTGNIVYFDIAYISMVTRPQMVNGRMVPSTQHQTSLHYIEGEGWRYYDGMNMVNTLSAVPNNLYNSNRVVSINYFRRVVRKNP